MKTTLVPAKGRWADFSSTGHPLSWYQALKAAGFAGVVIDIMTPGWPPDYNFALEAGLDVMFVQGYYAPYWNVPSEAKTRAQYVITQVRSVKADPGVTLFLDAESMGSISATAAIAWMNAWDAELWASGYRSLGKYEGWNCPLTGVQWYSALTLTSHYWRSKSVVPTIPTRGYQLVQTGIQHLFDGVAIDEDTAWADQKGDYAMAIHNPNFLPPPSVTTTTDWKPAVDALKKQVADLQSQNQALSAKVQAAGKALQA